MDIDSLFTDKTRKMAKIEHSRTCKVGGDFTIMG